MFPATLQSPGEQWALDNTMGSLLIGVILSAILYGISVVQTLYYYSRYSKDTMTYKLLVAVIMFLDTVHLLMIVHTIYHYLIVEYYNPNSLNFMIWSVLAESIPTGITGSLVQCFYAYRVWNLSGKNIFLTGFILVLVVACSGCGTAWAVLSLLRETYTELLEISALTMTINALSAANDVFIALSLCIMLQRSRTGFRRSDTMISRLIVFVVNTGLLTSLCAMGALISLIVSPNSLIYASWYFCIGRLYSNSLLASLNARQILRGQITATDLEDTASDVIISMPQFAHTGTRTGAGDIDADTIAGTKSGFSIRIDTTTKRHTDDGEPISDNLDRDRMTSSASSITKF